MVRELGRANGCQDDDDVAYPRFGEFGVQHLIEHHECTIAIGGFTALVGKCPA